MTTFEPGARDVFTHGFTSSPFSTALRARRAAASITDGFDVFVQLVMAAITTWPWSISKAVPSSSFTGTAESVGGAGASSAGRAALGCGTEPPSAPAIDAGGSLAGNDSIEASSWLALRT